jgi:hypothetical protein
MSETKEKIKYPGFLNKIWHDPVWGKVIYAGFIFLAGLIYSFIATLSKEISFYDAFVKTINFTLPLYVIFIIVTLAVVIYAIIYKIRQKKKKHIGKFDVEEKVGNFTFRELYNALLTHEIEAPLEMLQYLKDGKIDLLALFISYQRHFNLGVEWKEDHYSHYTLGPTLMSYGLTERVPNKNKSDSLGIDMIQTSKVGLEFYAMLERFRVYNDENMKGDSTQTVEPKKPESK